MAKYAPQSYICGSWPVTLGRVGPQKAQCSSLATYGGTVRIASHIRRLSGLQLIAAQNCGPLVLSSWPSLH